MVAQVQGAKGPIITNKVRRIDHPMSATGPPYIPDCHRASGGRVESSREAQEDADAAGVL